MRISPAVRSLLFVLVMLSLSAASFGQIGIAISIAPPALPVYEQPLCPGDGYLWTPGYWAWDGDFDDYYWIPGTWVMAPEVGYLWTPPYWGWGDGGFLFHEGYWGPTVGFYGGIAYGFGYFGVGFEGGRWDNGHFFYNRAVMNVNVTEIHNVYEERVTNITVNRVSYNGGNGGVMARATAREEEAARERHIPAVAAQTQHIQAARGNPELRASRNEGKPPVAATSRAGDFKGPGVVQAREAGAPYHAPAKARTASSAPRDAKNAVHPSELSPAERPAAVNTGNAKQDKKYQQQQDKLMAQQDEERQKLQQQQDNEHQKLAQQQANDARKQQVEQKHQQQTQQLQQKHTQQIQHLQERQQPARSAPKPPKGKQ